MIASGTRLGPSKVVHLVRPLPTGPLYVDAGVVAGSGDAIAFSAPSSEAAAMMLIGQAARIAQALPTEADVVRIVGEGILAQLVREALKLPRSATAQRPKAIVDTTGRACVRQMALQDLSERGTLVLAAPPQGGDWEFDTYPDLHGRGLTVVGVPLDPSEPLSEGGDGAVLDDVIANLVTCAEGQKVPPGTLWCRIEPAESPS